MPKYQITSIELLKKIISELTDDPTRPWSDYPCLVWPRALKCDGGYGQLGENNKTKNVHRRAFEIAYGPLPPGIQAAHHCDNKPCFRPSHLYAATNQQNTIDAFARMNIGRAHLHGLRNPASKLTEEQVKEIKELRKTGWQLRPLGAKFGVAFSTIRVIVIGKAWTHI